MTGEGLTTPSAATGAVTTVSATLPLTPQPLLPVTVLIDGQPATISFYGEAPGLVSGVMQLNVQIPLTVPSGNLPLVVSVGGTNSPNGVTKELNYPLGYFGGHHGPSLGNLLDCFQQADRRRFLE